MASLSNRILTILVLATLLPFLTGATIIIRGPRVAAASFTYYSAVFDGTNDYLTRGADLTGLADGKIGLVSFWYKSTGDAVTQVFLRNSDGYFYVSKSSSDLIQVIGYDSGGTPRLDLISTSTVTEASGWVHILISWDLGTAGRSYIYINGSDVTTRNTHSNVDIDLVRGDWAVGATVDALLKADGLLCELYFTTPAAWFDITDSANRDKFFNSGTSKPVDLGSDGSTPTGVQPIVYLKTQPTAWETNSGSGGNFTETGSITDGGGDIP